MVTHDPDVAERAQRVIRMRDGKVVSEPLGGLPASPGSGEALPPRLPPRLKSGHAVPEPVGRPGRLGQLEALRMGAASVFRRKLRTGLSASGVAIGIGAMALIVALATGISTTLVSAFSAAGQLQQVSVNDFATGPGPASTQHKTLDQPALDTLARLPHVTDAWGQMQFQGSVAGNGQSINTVIAFSDSPVRQTPAFASRFLAAGSLPTSDTEPQALVSGDGAKKLGWTAREAVGKHVTFKALYPGLLVPGSGVEPAKDQIALDLLITGVASGLSGGPGTNLVISYNAASKYGDQMAAANSWKADKFQQLTLVADSPGNVDKVRDAVKKLGYPAVSGSDTLKQLQTVLVYLELGLSGLAAIALVVACLGIANTMYTAVLERTREIGVLKALGARGSDVRLMFMSEAAAIGALGGAVGVAITFLLSLVGNAIINSMARGQGFGLDINVFQMTIWLGVGAILLAAAFSSLSGLLPAIRASRLNPVLALRYE